MEGLGSLEASRSALVAGNTRVDPISLSIWSGAPISGWRRFQPVYAARGHAYIREPDS